MKKTNMKETRSLGNAIKNNVPVVDSLVTLWADSFNKNIFTAIDIHFNKNEFDLERSQMFFISKDLEIEKTKNYLEKKGITPERIEIVEDWSQMPFSTKNLSRDTLTEFFANTLIRQSEYKDYELTRLIILFHSVITDIKVTETDLENLPEYTLENLPESFTESNKFIKEWIDYSPFTKLIFADYFQKINAILKLFYIDNKIKQKTYYLLKPKTLEEEIIFATYIKRIDEYNNSYNGYEYEEWQEFTCKEKELNKIYKTAFVDFKDYYIRGYGVYAATERRSVRLNVFLTQNSFSKELYQKDELMSLMAHSALKYGEENTPLRRLICDNGFINYYKELKKEIKEKSLVRA